MVNALLEFSHPLHPNLRIQTHYVPFNTSLQGSQTLKSQKLKRLWYLILSIVVSKVEICEVKSLSWSDGHTDLISEEGVVDEVDRIAVAHHHYDASDDLPDLVVDEALPDDVETQVMFIYHADSELYDVSLSLSVLCLQILGVVVEIVGSDVQTTAFIQLFQDFLLFLWRPASLQHICLLFHLFALLLLRANEHDLRTNVGIVPRLDHVPYLKPIGDSLEAVIHNLAALEQFLQLSMQSLPIQGFILQQIVVPQAKQAGNSINYRMDSFISPCSPRPTLTFLKLPEVIGGQQAS